MLPKVALHDTIFSKDRSHTTEGFRLWVFLLELAFANCEVVINPLPMPYLFAG